MYVVIILELLINCLVFKISETILQSQFLKVYVFKGLVL